MLEVQTGTPPPLAPGSSATDESFFKIMHSATLTDGQHFSTGAGAASADQTPVSLYSLLEPVALTSDLLQLASNDSTDPSTIATTPAHHSTDPDPTSMMIDLVALAAVPPQLLDSVWSLRLRHSTEASTASGRQESLEEFKKTICSVLWRTLGTLLRKASLEATGAGQSPESEDLVETLTFCDSYCPEDSLEFCKADPSLGSHLRNRSSTPSATGGWDLSLLFTTSIRIPLGTMTQVREALMDLFLSIEI
jgi:hypothetical protein